MALKIFISSAVKLDEKKHVKDKLVEMRKQRIIKFDDDDLYDCADHATLWSSKSKQEVINNQIILNADWFICLIPEATVGTNTWKELKYALEAHKEGLPIVISVFHPKDVSANEKEIVTPDNRCSFDYIRQQAEIILGNKEEQYWITYQSNNREDLQKQLHDEFVRLYYTDRVFRTQHLNGLAELGHQIKPKDIYFDKERAEINNGFLINKYFPRCSVDGKLQEAIMEQRKFIVIQGAPGSGKTRAMYQLMADPKQLMLTNDDHYALGFLCDRKVIVVHQDNVHQVYQFLESEKDYDSSEFTLSDYFLVVDQLKDVFGMLTNEELFRFFDMVAQFKHVHMIVTSIPSAFINFCERWKDYGRKPFEDDKLTKIITIPQISSDNEESAMRNWMQNELQGYSKAETIGDYIPNLNNYKQTIVQNLYKKIEIFPFLSKLLSSFQIIETFRYDTALFLPIMVLRKNIYPREEPNSWKDFYKEVAKTLNYLIDNNVIWVRQLSNSNGSVKKLQEEVFSLDYDMDDKEDFIFDDELYPETPLSTSYTYGVNEIVWSELGLEDARRHLNQSDTLLKDFRIERDVVRAAKEFYRAFPSIRTLSRILPRIPKTDCYDKASESLWDFAYRKCADLDIVPNSSDKDEYLFALGILIGRSKDLEQIKKVINILLKKGFCPSYSIIGELYSAGLRLDKGIQQDIIEIVSTLRTRFKMNDQNFFSLTRKILLFNIPFNSALEEVRNSKYVLQEGAESMVFQNAAKSIKRKDDLASLGKLLNTLAKRAETIEQWKDVFNLHRLVHVMIRRSHIHLYFTVVANLHKILLHERDFDKQNVFMRDQLQMLIEEYNDIIAEEDRESCYFYSVEASWNFSQAHAIYQLYYDTYGIDNQRLISMVLHTLRNYEFQKALNFLVKVDKRLKSIGSELNIICFNNLIKSAPNMGEALGVVPFLSHLQDHTLANILNVLKNKRSLEDKNTKTGRVQDSKIFYYAYSAVMRDEFLELRKSPHVIGILYELATTPKHERFIRNVYLSHLDEIRKRDLIDYSTSITSIRLQKNYRTIEDVWKVFSICRDHYHHEKLFINSELYSSMMRKLKYLCGTEKTLNEQRKRLRTIIEEDSDRIIRDEYYYPSLYRFFPEKQVFDNDGNMSRVFIKEIMQSEISQIIPFNNLMESLKSRGFDLMWKFYEFIVRYYMEKGKRKLLKPEVRTVTYLMEAVTSKEQFVKVEEAAKLWCIKSVLEKNKLYQDTYWEKMEKLGLGMPNTNRSPKEDDGKKNNSTQTNYKDFKERVDDIINFAESEIYQYGSLTPTLFNRHLQAVEEIVNGFGKAPSKYIKDDNIQKKKASTYRNLIVNLIDKHAHEISFDAISYVYLINLSPGECDVKRWIEELKKKKNIYKYDMVVCAKISQSIEICRADIGTALDYFEFWEEIVQNIGYDPEDSTSISDKKQFTYYNKIKDYDGFWLTRCNHCIREMAYYWNRLNKDHFVDKTALGFIKRQMEYFDRVGIPFPDYYANGIVVDFKKEIICKLNAL